MRTVRVMVFLLGIYGFVMGAVFASFGSVRRVRGPRGDSVNGRSHCTCGRQLKWWENVPLLGWLRTRGVAPCCSARLPARYVVAEASLGVVGGGIGVLAARAWSDGSSLANIAAASMGLFAVAWMIVLVLTWQGEMPHRSSH
jgi:leader peptidase (prepilin peptidase)/N-methyltransferase